MDVVGHEFDVDQFEVSAVEDLPKDGVTPVGGRTRNKLLPVSRDEHDVGGTFVESGTGAHLHALLDGSSMH